MSDPVTTFEARFASMIGADYAIAVNSGTSALHCALEALEVRGGEVIMPALGPGLVAFPILAAGAAPVFADVDPVTQLISRQTVAPLVNLRTRAIIAVALHGLSTDVHDLKKLRLPIIEDCAQALLARYKDGFAGTFGTIGCYSFEKKKHLTTGSEGGMIVTDDAALAKAARAFGGLGYRHLDAGGGGTRVPVIDPDCARFDQLGLNYRLSEVQADIGLQKLKTAAAAVSLRQEIGALWEQTIGERLQVHNYSADHAFYTAAWPYPGNWKKLHQRFALAGGDGFYAAPLVGYNEPALKHYASHTPVAANLQRSLVVLKTHYQWPEAVRQAKIFSECLQSSSVSA